MTPIRVRARCAAEGPAHVVLTFQGQSIELTTDDARALAFSILSAAEAAHSDELLRQFAAQIAPERAAQESVRLQVELQLLRQGLRDG